MVTYISPFATHLSDLTTHLRKLLQKDVDFQWHPEHEEAFRTLKRLICEAGSLAYFDPSKQTIIQVDASQDSLGAALVQAAGQ